MTYTLLFVALLITHILADFYWQPMRWVNSRNSKHFRSKALYWHVLIHGVSSALIIMWWEYSYGWQQLSTVFIASITIVLSHYFIDLAKSYSNKGVIAFSLDQIAHIIVLFLVTLFVVEPPTLLNDLLSVITDTKILIVLCAYLIILNPCAVFIKMMLERLTHQHTAQDSLPLAGQSIGMLERILMLSFILIEQFSGVGFLLAAKSVFRFGDLTASKDKKLTEYVMLGTLLSVTVSVLIGLTTRYLLTLQN
ncbi:DUF3307 domain-containing protein [Pseudoalteromonas sp. MMG010]|uniref:DUF3307 domain-containing protein n=1 Tax=Pseudoalteromonas sp. MMG010 TaxID=2822685 RepID=UPI001B3A0C9F|nr:DUF3307 domain-containing protein [Pseudoalteromonas sp. MMG010]MBQ4834646.1 DUF3307 domain-containing protein [Pseudoalteromonas sp. MMG010]